MREREIKIAEYFGITKSIEKIEADLLQIEFVESVEFDLFGFYDDLNQVIILTRYNIPTHCDTYFTARIALIGSVIKKAKEHGLKRTLDKIEDYGKHFYFVFEIDDKEKFYDTGERKSNE